MVADFKFRRSNKADAVRNDHGGNVEQASCLFLW